MWQKNFHYESAMMDDYSVAISSILGEGMIDLVSTIEDALMALLLPIEVLLPYAHDKEVNMVQEGEHVEEIDYKLDGPYLWARVPEGITNHLMPLNIDGESANSPEDDDVVVKDEIYWVMGGRCRHPKTEL